MSYEVHYNKVLGGVIKRLRKRANLRQVDCAKLLGVTHNVGWSRVENGLSRLSVIELTLFARAVGLHPGQITDLVDEAVSALERVGVSVVFTEVSAAPDAQVEAGRRLNCALDQQARALGMPTGTEGDVKGVPCP